MAPHHLSHPKKTAAGVIGAVAALLFGPSVAPRVAASDGPFLSFHASFEDPTLADASGELPLLNQNTARSLSFASAAGRQDAGLAYSSTPGAALVYPATRSDGTANFNPVQGSLHFWLRPDWSSGDSDAPARIPLVSIGAPGAADAPSENGYWTFSLVDNGASAVFQTQAPGATTVVNHHFNWSNTENRVLPDGRAPIALVAEAWHEVQLDWEQRAVTPYNNPANAPVVFAAAQLWVNRTRIASGNGVDPASAPNPTALADGFALAADRSGQSALEGLLDEFSIYSDSMLWERAAVDYRWAATVDASVPSIALTRRNPPAPAPLPAIDIYRRRHGEPTWTGPLATAFTGNQWIDSGAPIAVNQAFEYRLEVTPDPPDPFPDVPGVPQPQPAPKEDQVVYLPAAINLAPVHHRGKLILLVEDAVNQALGPEISAFRDLLALDGWDSVVGATARHQDEIDCPDLACDASHWAANVAEIERIKSEIIQAEYDPGQTCAVLILGHAPIPKSGRIASDGHAEHTGAWPCDGYYGSVFPADGQWTDALGSINLSSARFTNLPNDGKWDQDRLPDDVEMAVGRVDFAGLLAFADADFLPNAPYNTAFAADRTALELDLIRLYLDKNRRYRLRQTASARRVVYHRGFVDSALNFNGDFRARALAAALNGLDVSGAATGRPLFEAGPVGVGVHESFGQPTGLRYGFTDGVDQSHRTRDLAVAANEPPVVFHQAMGSFFIDPFFSNDNFLRSLIATPNFGLAAMAFPRMWYQEFLGLGAPLELGMRRMAEIHPPEAIPELFTIGEANRGFSVIGDPTLRLHPTPPPSNPTVETTEAGNAVRWAAATEAVAGYHVYRSVSGARGPFERRTIGSPLSGTEWVDPAPPDGDVLYAVKALNRDVTGCGSFWNLSQGVLATPVSAAP